MLQLPRPRLQLSLWLPPSLIPRNTRNTASGQYSTRSCTRTGITTRSIRNTSRSLYLRKRVMAGRIWRRAGAALEGSCNEINSGFRMCISICLLESPLLVAVACECRCYSCITSK
ncbi:hypothetical protein C8R47DRAFT_1312824 [Mycena vitilis]|nr:hypothetical protein C8R47DRAFT_1312824 [Mycena vitilis]